jgi:hypothetical protein
MKQLNSQQSEIRTYLDQQIQRIKARAVNDSEIDAKFCRPSMDETCHSVFQPHHLAIQGLIDLNAGEHGVDSIKHSGANQLQQGKEIIQKLEIQEFKVQDQLVDLELELQNTKAPYNRIRVIMAVMAMVLISLFEGLWTMPIWESIIGLGYRESLISSLLFAVVIGTFCHLTAEGIDRIMRKINKRLSLASVFALCFILFWHLGEMRAELLSQRSTELHGLESQLDLSALPFAILSTLLIFIGISMSYFYLPNKAERNQMDSYRALVKHVIELRDQKVEVSERIQKEKRKISYELLSKYERYEQGVLLEKYLINQSHLLLSIYQKKNLAFRKDGVIPLSFSKAYPFQFTTYYKDEDNENN